jgi:hypothetical protein
VDDAQYAAYGAYLRRLADALLLADWEIELKREAASDETWAQVVVMTVKDRALVWLGAAFWSASPERRRETIAHELIHCLLHRPERIMIQLAQQQGEDAVVQFANEAHRCEIEICAQRLARLLAPALPLPPE